MGEGTIKRDNYFILLVSRKNLFLLQKFPLPPLHLSKRSSSAKVEVVHHDHQKDHRTLLGSQWNRSDARRNKAGGVEKRQISLKAERSRFNS